MPEVSDVHSPLRPGRAVPRPPASAWPAPWTAATVRGMELLRQIAADEVFSAAAARSVGIAPQVLARLVTARKCYPITRGWYAVRQPADAMERHRLAATALAFKFAGHAVVGHHSALVRLGLPTFSADLRTVHLTRTDDGCNRRSKDVQLHLRLPGLTTGEAGGLLRAAPRPISVAYAAVQAGLLGEPRAALVAADAALHRGLVTDEQLADAVAAMSGLTGIGPVRAILQQADGRIESPGETLLGHAVRSLGLVLVPQYAVSVEGSRYRADFGVVGTRLLLEFDGKTKYADREALFAEKRREDALRRARWIVVRFTWDDLMRPGRLRHMIRTALQAAAA